MSESEPKPQSRSRTIPLLLAIIGVLFIWYVVSDRVTPFSSNARVQAYTVAIAPDVSGFVSEVKAKKNALIEAGAPLAQIDTTRFETAVAAAEAELEAAGQDVGASTASVSTATAALVSARASLEEVRAQSNRILALEEKGIYAKAKGDEARAAIETAEAGVAAAEAELERARQIMGSEGAENPRVRLATAKLAEAQLNLERATLVSPVPAIVGTLKIEEGAYANAGQPLMTLISLEDQWVEAFLTENNLGGVNPGDKVEITFDAFPGRVYSGKVKSIAWGVSTGKAVNLGDLPVAEKSKGWLRDAQRFSVIIETTDYEPATDVGQQGLRLNSQASVVVYTDEGFFWNALAKGWIRLVSWASYLY